MSEEKNSSVASEYVHKELAAARSAVKWSKVVGILLTLIICGYFSVLTTMLKGFLVPKDIAEMAVGQALELIDSNAQPLKDKIETAARKYLSSMPDELIKRMPEVREKFETKLIAMTRAECEKHAAELGKKLEMFHIRHADAVEQFVDAALDRETIAILAQQMSEEFRDTLILLPLGMDESLGAKIDLAHSGLERMEEQLRHLAANQNLSPNESNQRRAIAMMARATQARATQNTTLISDSD